MVAKSLHFGTKVGLISKSAGITSLGESFCWRKAKEIGQNFLFVVGYDEKGYVAWILNYDMELGGGDYFQSDDFEILELPDLQEE